MFQCFPVQERKRRVRTERIKEGGEMSLFPWGRVVVEQREEVIL